MVYLEMIVNILVPWSILQIQLSYYIPQMDLTRILEII